MKNITRLTVLVTAGLMVAACSSTPSVRKEIEQSAAKPKPLPGPTAAVPKEPVVRTLPGAGLKETPLVVKPLPQAAPPAVPSVPLAPTIERAPVADLPQQAGPPQAGSPTSSPTHIALATPAPSGSPAVMALTKRADEEMRANDLVAAAATLERALRIDPNNAGLWSRLAEVRLRQGDKVQAEQLALKSNGLAAGNPALKARNDQIIAQARGR
ncbi:MAG: tetratricopeptide repeat protein [Halothiobacillaceae bacterium]